MSGYLFIFLIIVIVLTWLVTSAVFFGAWNYVVGEFVVSVGKTGITTGSIDYTHALVFMTGVWAFFSPLIILTAVSLRSVAKLSTRIQMQ